MDNKIITIMPPKLNIPADTDPEELYDMCMGLLDIKNKFGNVEWFDYEKFLKYTDEIHDTNAKHMEKVLSIISQFYGKYISLKFEVGETRTLEYLLLPYLYVPANGRLFGVFVQNSSEYNSGVKDDSIDFITPCLKYKTSIQEITEEEFLEKAHASVDACLNQRLVKIESGNYELTKNGYKFVGYKVECPSETQGMYSNE